MMSPRKPWPRGMAPIRARVSVSMPLVMNRSMTPVLVDDPKGGVAGTDERTDLVDDDLEDLLDREHARDRTRRGIERIEDLELGQVAGTVGHRRRA